MARVLITAGPTQEPIDAVRFIGNRSSGRMGLALADAAARAGHAVTLLLGPIAGRVKLERGVTRHPFRTTADLDLLLREHGPTCDALIMAAAVADFRPASVTAGKLPRGERLTLELEPTPDLVAGCVERRRDHQQIIGFALEPADGLVERATAKLHRKGVDAIVANPLETLDAEHIDATLIRRDAAAESPGAMSKAAFAEWLMTRVALNLRR